MCLVFFSYQYPEGYDFFIASNRDEFYARKTKSAHFWEEDSSVLAGKDLEAGGTWLGIQDSNRFAFLTNYRNLYLPKTENSKSRGLLVKNYLLGRESSKDYSKNVYAEKDQYEGFNLVVGDSKECYYLNNKQNIFKRLDSGIYGLSNATLDSNWGKVIFVKENIGLILQEQFENDSIFSVLQDKAQYGEAQLPDTGIGLEKEKLLSPCFIEIPNYGTRSSTILYKKQNDILQFEEKIWVS